MGGKTSSTQPPAIAPVTPTEYPGPSLIAPAAPEAIAPPPLQPLPEVARTPEVDWSARQSEILAKARADYRTEVASQKGRRSTVRTGSALDDKDPETTTSLLVG